MKKSKNIFHRIRRSPYQSLAAISIMTLTFFVGAIFFVLALSSASIINYFESKPQITAFFKDNTDQNKIAVLVDKLKSTEKVSATKYISKEEALSIYKEQNKNDPLLLEMVTADILPASLEVSPKDPKYLVDINEILKNDTSVQEVVFQKDIIDNLLVWTNAIKKVGLLAMMMLLFTSVVVMMTLSGMKISLKKEEIEILKQLGATKWYIRKPFISEGVFYGFISATVAWVLVVSLYLYSSPFLNSFLSGISELVLFSWENITLTIWPISWIFLGLLYLGMVLFGVVIGSFSSILALSRYLKF